MGIDLHGACPPGRVRRAIGGLAVLTALAAAALPGSASAATVRQTWYVSASATSEPACSVASAANAFQSIAGALGCAHNGDTVKVGAGTFAGQLTIPVNVTLEGAGANRTTIQNAKNSTTAPEVTLAAGVSAKIENLEIDGETADKLGKSPGIAMTSGSLLLERVAVVSTSDGSLPGSPSSPQAPVSVQPTSGTGSLTVLDSTISGSFSGGVGGIYVLTPQGSTAQSTATIVNSTITGNYGGGAAGGVSLTRSQATLRDDTITGDEGRVGGLEIGEGSTVTVADTIIAANKAQAAFQDDCSLLHGGATLVDSGHNLIGIDEPAAYNGCSFANGSNGDLAGTVASPVNAQLGALAFNGGTTETMALQAGSPAINAGNPTDCNAAPVSGLDQRGSKRNATTRKTCDIGAYDTGGAGAHVWYVSASATSEPACSVASAANAFQSIAGALGCAHNGDTVKVGAGTFAGQFTIPVNVTLEGAGANRTTIRNATASRTVSEVMLAAGVSVKIENLVVDGESEPAHNTAGIVMTTGSLLLERVAVVDTEDGSGGTGTGNPNVAYAPVSVQPSSGTGSLTVLDSTISGAISDTAGGVYVGTPQGSTAQSSATIVNSTITGNYGGVLAGGVAVLRSQATLRDDTISGNEATAGGLYIGEHSTVTVADTIIAANKGGSPSTGDCSRAASGPTLVDGGHNLIGVDEPSIGIDCTFQNGSNGDLVGTVASPVNPQLGPLAFNGGSTETMALQPGSPAINAGSPVDCNAAPVSGLDQRGSKRNATTRKTCDIGAYDTGGA